MPYRCRACVEEVMPVNYRPGWKHRHTHSMVQPAKYEANAYVTEVSAYNLECTLAPPAFEEACACDDEPLGDVDVYVRVKPDGKEV